MSEYKDTIVEKYLDLIKDNTTTIKGFYNGMVGKIPASMLPAVILTIEGAEAESLSNSEDEHRLSMLLIYVADVRQSLNDSALVNNFNRVLDALMGRDSNYSLKSTSLLYILRNNLNVDITNNLRTDVGSFSVVTPSEISTGRFPGFYSVEGTIRFNAHFYQER